MVDKWVNDHQMDEGQLHILNLSFSRLQTPLQSISIVLFFSADAPSGMAIEVVSISM